MNKGLVPNLDPPNSYCCDVRVSYTLLEQSGKLSPGFSSSLIMHPLKKEKKTTQAFELTPIAAKIGA